MSGLEDIKARLRAERIRVTTSAEAIADMEYARKMLEAKGLKPELQHKDFGDALAMWLVVRVPLAEEGNPTTGMKPVVLGCDLAKAETVSDLPPTGRSEIENGDAASAEESASDESKSRARLVPEAVKDAANAPTVAFSIDLAPAEVEADADEPDHEHAPLRTGAWSKTENHRLVELMGQGKNAREIGRDMGRDARGVATKMRYLGAAIGALDDGDPDEQPASDPAPEADEEEGAPAAPVTYVAKVYAPAEADGPMPGTGAPPHPVDIEAMPAAQRVVERRLRRLGYPSPHTPLTDLWLVMALVGGAKLDGAAENAGLTRDDAKARWHALLPEVTIEAQNALVAVLRTRVGKGAP